jgi:uncharacterized protein YqjF (DUF2071 family)
VAQRQSWKKLTFLHWRVPEAVLRPLVPAELTLDTFEGDAFVGLVPFTMTGVRPLWAPAVPGISNFHETNVRTYVHKDGRDPGVWFFSLDAASRVAVTVARTFWHLPYHHARMSLDEAEGEIRYVTERLGPPPVPAGCKVTTRVLGAVSPAVGGTLEHFLAERYILYADTGGGSLSIGRVHHVPYPLQRAEAIAWEESLLQAAGIARPNDAPLAHYADGVDVEIFALEPLGSGAT